MKVNIAPPKGIIELQNYIEWLVANGIDYKVLSAGDKVDGTLILSGGPDIGVNKHRDELEFEWLKQAIEGGHKVLGVCRGMQLINVYFDGIVENLHEYILEDHIADQFSDDECHNERLSQFHWVKNIKTGSTFITNSRHHQHCAVLGRKLIPVYYSLDYTVEGFVSPDRMIMGIQWHPERNEVNIPSYNIGRQEPINFLKNFH